MGEQVSVLESGTWFSTPCRLQIRPLPYSCRVRIIDSANRHGVPREDITRAWAYFVTEFVEQEDPVKVIRLGFDTVGRLLEVGAVVNHTGEVIIIHAMTAKPKYTRRIGRKLL